MKNNRGYTAVEVLAIIIVVGVLAFVAINKASYAFPDHSRSEDIKESQSSLVETIAIKYGTEHKEIFKESDTVFIRIQDLIENKYLEENSLSELNNNQKIKLVFSDEKVHATLES